MTLDLMRRGRVLRGLPRWLVVATAATTALIGVRGLLLYHGTRGGAADVGTFGWQLLFALGLWVPIVPGLVWATFIPRFGELEMTLPLTARRLWTSRLLAVLACGFSLLGVSIAQIVLIDGFLRRHVDPGAGSHLAAFLPSAAAGLLLAVILLHRLEPTQRLLQRSRGHVLYVIAVLLACLGIVLAGARLSPLYLLAPVTLAGAILLWEARKLPAAIDLLPSPGRSGSLDRGGPITAREVDPSWRRLPSAAPSRRVAFNVATRSLQGRGKSIAGLVLTAAIGLFLSGMAFLFGEDGDGWVIFVPLVWYMSVIGAHLSLRGIPSLDPLPISRRFLFAIVILPGMLAYLAGYGSGVVFESAAEAPQERVLYAPSRQDSTGYSVLVPLDVFEIAWSGKPPRIVSPWGEAHDAQVASIARDCPVQLIKPFTADQSASADFVAWQISRAAEAVYGSRIPWTQVKERYLRTVEGRVVPAEGGLTIATDHGHPRARGRPLRHLFVLVLSLAPALVLCVPLFALYRPGVSERRRKRGVICFAGLPVALLIVLEVLIFTHALRPQVLTAFFSILLRRAVGDTAGGVAAATAGGAALFLLCYLWAERQFSRMEILSSGENRSAE